MANLFRPFPIPEAIGLYMIGNATGVVSAPGANAEVFQFRNPSSTLLCVVEAIVVSMSNAAAVTLAQEFGWNLHLCTAWSADGTGGTALTPMKRRQVFDTSAVASTGCRISTTAGLGAGTKTISTEAFANGPGPNTNAIGQAGGITNLDGGESPLFILAANEGFTVRNAVAYADGSARYHVHVRWGEYLV